ncbi:MAG: STAS domain-containing protein [Gemmatimonadales bacterium]|nr:STAS domain-containing protein [Gemmatimonadales bacterium]
MSKRFTITQDKENNSTPILHLAGRLDADGAHALRTRVLELKERGSTRIIVHLAELEFVASSGLGTFLLLTEEFLDVGGSISFVAPSPDVRQVISLMNIDQFLNLVDTEEQALELC